tara:strand:+ start:1051 stop:1998 length:948 start_codon:yes stop_codon:yes gene_type:complete
MSDFKVNSIIDRGGVHGPSIAGVATVNSTGCMKIPSGDTSKRVTLPQSSENIVTDQLFALYDAGHGSLREGGGTTLRDVSGNGRDLPMATIADPNSNTNRAVTFDSANGGGIRFTYPGAQWWREEWGDKYNFTIGNPNEATYNQFSVEMWYKIPSTTDRIHLWEFGSSNLENIAPYSNIHMNLNDGRSIWVYTDNGSPRHVFTSSGDGDFTDGTIRNLTYTYDYGGLNSGGTLGLGLGYMNGSLITGTSLTGDQQWNINQGLTDGYFPWFTIGGVYTGHHHWPDGSILYKCAVYTKALSASEVSQNYNALLYRFS